jgi:hypothetical protein
MNTNIVFVRHGFACHNAISGLVKKSIITADQGYNLTSKSGQYKMVDPELTEMGVDATIHNGCVVNKILKNLKNEYNDQNLNMDTMNIVGCSPLIRCMETAYYMTRKWKNPPSKIYVLPLLREIDEHSEDKNSKASIKRLDTIPSYAMKSIPEQKVYLKSIGLLDYFDFSFVEMNPDKRKAPGDIVDFLFWFGKDFLSTIEPRDNLNVFITTHAGVLRDYFGEGFINNSGFVLNMNYPRNSKRLVFKKSISLNRYLDDSDFFTGYTTSDNYYCPSNRCGQLCSFASKKENSSQLKRLDLKCDNED